MGHPLYGVFGIIALLLCLYKAHMLISRWEKAEGFAPASSTNRTGNREYKKLLSRSLPYGIKQKVLVLQGLGLVLAVIGICIAIAA